MIAAWPMWMFRHNEQRLFREGEEIPHGWMDRPSPFNVPDPTVFDPDGDHSFGGAVKPQDATHVVSWKADPSEVAQVNPVKRGPGRPRKIQL